MPELFAKKQRLFQRRANEKEKGAIINSNATNNDDATQHLKKCSRSFKTCQRLKLTLIFLVLIASFKIGREIFIASSKRGHVWRAYFAPSVAVWDDIHGGTEAGKKHDGGIWSYSYERLKTSGPVQYIKMEEIEWDESSSPLSTSETIRIWDVACNVGYMLEAICGGVTAGNKVNMRGSNSQKNVNTMRRKECFGTDISHVMVNKTIANCAHCTRAAQFDLSALRQELSSVSEYDVGNSNSVLPLDFPSTFEYIIVSDVLLYIPWGGFPPLLLGSCVMCRHASHVREEQLILLQNLQQLTAQQIVISDHQQNPIVVDMMSFAKERLRNALQKEKEVIGWHPKQKVWTIAGTAST